MLRGRHIAFALLAASVAAALVSPTAAQAGFPGGVGAIVYVQGFSGNAELYSVSPFNGAQYGPFSYPTTIGETPEWSASGFMLAFSRVQLEDPPHLRKASIYSRVASTGTETPLTGTSDDDETPTWSPDGQQIAFTRWHEDGCDYEHGTPVSCFGSSHIVVMNSDGSNQTPLPTTTSCDQGPSWSPRGDKIAFSRCGSGVWVMNPDGSGQVQLTSGADAMPDWSPDGGRIVFCRCATGGGVYSIKSDGTELTPVVPNPGSDPAWSPDGSKIAYTHGTTNGTEIYTVNVDGTGDTVLITAPSPSPRPHPTWRPVALTYVRPRGATPFRVSLVPAQKQCTAPNDTHGSPLAFSSCRPAQLVSDYLTTGTPDANGRAARMNGYLQASVRPGNPNTTPDEADVAITVGLNDVANKDLTDYTGSLHVNLPVRITDTNNTPTPFGTDAATTQPFAYGFQIPCVADPNPGVGSDCSLSTTLDALVPGTILESRRSIWQLGQVRVFDGGADGDGSTTADNTVFAVQGVFVP